MKFWLKLVTTIIAIALIITGFFGFIIHLAPPSDEIQSSQSSQSSNIKDDEKKSKLKRPIQPEAMGYGFIEVIGWGILFVVYHKKLFTFASEIMKK